MVVAVPGYPARPAGYLLKAAFLPTRKYGLAGRLPVRKHKKERGKNKVNLSLFF
jgi:hypothetical protein